MPKIYQIKYYCQPRRGEGFEWIHPRTGKRISCAGVEFYVDYRDEQGKRQRRKAHDGVCRCPPRQRGLCPHERIAMDLVAALKAGSRQEVVHPAESTNESVAATEDDLPVFFERYLADLDASRRHRPKTKQNKKLSIRVFRDFCRRKRIIALSSVSRSHIEAFRNELGKRTIHRGKGEAKKEGRWKANTINRYLRDVRAMFNKAARWGLISENPARSLGPGDDLFLPETDQREITILTPDELNLLFRLRTEDISPLFVRNAQTILDMLLLFYRCGLRLGELCNLTFRQVRSGVLHIEPHDDWIPKWGIRRAVPVDAEALVMIERRREAGRRGKYVFETSTGNRFEERNVGDDFSKLFTKFGIVGDTGVGVSTHCLRHTFCTTCLTSGVPITTVKDWMGHTEIEMTMRYYHKIAALTDTHMNRVNFVGAGGTNRSTPIDMHDSVG